MKLNENGDFCLLYIEPADGKQQLFATIGEQHKPVVLMLPPAGQPRPKLFQRPEDFSDLKHIRRQIGIPIVFLTAGSDLLTQMATRYGFPAYPTIDDFANFLAHGQYPPRDEGQFSPSAPRRARTGPLIPSAAQLAALRQSLSTTPTHGQDNPRSWTTRAPAPETEPAAYTMAFHEAETVPIGMASRRARSTGPADVPGTSAASGRVYGYQTTDPLSHTLSLPTGDSALPPSREFPRPHPHSTQLSPLPQTRYPNWEAEEQLLQAHSRSALTGSPISPVPPPASRRPAGRPTRDLREYPPAPSLDAPGALRNPSHPLTGPSARLTAAPPAGTPARPQPGSPSRQLTTSSSARLTAVPPARNPARLLPDSSGNMVAAPIRTKQAPTQVPPLLPPLADAPRGNSNVWPLLVILSLLILVGGALGSFVAIAHVTPAPAIIQQVGTITFTSSEQINENTSQGINDQVRVSLRDLNMPATGKTYYAWLLGDQAQVESQSILLGKLQVSHGTASLFYPGDAQHTNLLQITSRFLVTEENSNFTPLMPSPDTRNWRYYGALPTTPDPKDAHHYSFLDHLRHLLAAEPILDEMGLPGGLNNWFTRNTQKLVELTTSARDRWQNGQSPLTTRTQGLQILAYLDGMSFLPPDVPSASADIQAPLDTHQAALGLLNLRGPSQNPPSYIDQLVFHLNGLLNAPGSPAGIRATAGQILPTLSNVNTRLQTLRGDDKRLLALSNFQLDQPTALALLNDMVLQASKVYTGGTDSTSGSFKQGVAWIHQQLQSMATISVSTYTTGSPTPSANNPTAQPGLASRAPLALRGRIRS